MMRMISQVIVLLCMMATSLAWVINVQGAQQRAPENKAKLNCSDRSACETEECISTAARIIESLDQSVDPCDNFYQFACGGWLKKQILPPHKISVISFNDVDKNLAAARNALVAESEPSELSAIKKARYLYDSCIDYAKKPKGTTALVDIIRSRFGSWPKTEDWDESEFDLGDYISKASSLLVYPLFEFTVEVMGGFTENGKVFATHFLAVKEPKLAIPFSLYNEDDHLTVRAYKASIEKDASIFGYKIKSEDTVDDNNENDENDDENENNDSNKDDDEEEQDNNGANDAINEIFEVEKTVALLYAEAKNEITNYTLEELQENFGDLLNWIDFATGLLSSPEVGVTDITPEEIVAVVSPAYLANLTEYFSALPARTQANYIIWRVIDTLKTVLVKKTDVLKTIMKQAIYGVTADPSAEETCVTYVSQVFSLVLHRLMYEEAFPTDEILQMHNLMAEIQQEFDHVVKEHDWVDEETANAIRRKNAALATTLVSFQQAMDDSLLEAYYANVSYGNGSFAHNDLVNREQTFQQKLRLLRKPFEFSSENLPHEIVAQNNFLENRLEFSSVIFEPPLFSRHIPQSLNYGGMGMVYAHEIVHAFDSSGYTRNEEGIKGEWWSKETVAKFQERLQCLIEQYSDFYFEMAEANVNGNLTIGENIADNGGIKLAYRAYRKFVEARGSEEQLLPGLSFSNDQLFFINFAQMWCSVETEEAAKYIVENDVHSPGKFRVIGTAQNSKDFSRIFRCPVGSYMNPETKCAVW